MGELGIIEESVMSQEAVRLYKLQPDLHYGFYMGHDAQNYQYIVHHLNEHKMLFIIQFTAQGKLVGVTKEQIIPSLHKGYNDLIEMTLKKLGLTLGLIEIEKFYLDEYAFGIKDLPEEEEEESLQASSAPEEDGFDDLIKEWMYRGDFILECGSTRGGGVRDFWLDANGLITDS
jgi:hypothetical protein